ncbi:MAG: hypothetical protein ACXVRZ_08540 [Gaiellaceae bacterium]
MWRVSPGEYVRLRLADALAQATGSRPNADWVLTVEREIDREVPTLGALIRPSGLKDSPNRPAPPEAGLTSQGTANGRFTRAIQQRNLFQAELALREMRTPSLLVALDYLALLAELKPERFQAAAVRWHGRLEVEAPLMTIGESQLTLAALASLCAGERESVEILRRLLRRARPTLVRSIG